MEDENNTTLLTNLNNENNTTLDNEIAKTEKEYEELKQEHEKRLKNRSGWAEFVESSKLGKILNQIGNLFTGGKINKEQKAYDEQTELTRNQRDQIFQRLQELKAKKAEYLTNIEAAKNKYKIELEGLKKIGITNPYYLLKNGTIQGGGGANISNINGQLPQYTNRQWLNNTLKNKDYISEILKEKRKEQTELLKLILSIIK